MSKALLDDDLALLARARIGSLRSVFRSPAINVYSRDVVRLVTFYQGLGFREMFRTPKEGQPDHVEVVLDGFTIGIASVDSAIADHGLNPNLEGRPVEIVLWTDDTDRDHACLTADGAPSLSEPHDWLSDLRLAWVADPDGNPIQLVQRRKRDGALEEGRS
jgi:catechol 2,3-dioxygenase-like lactoylglutathione lyase family enzyme